jgi:hypothetical protein
VTRPRWFNDHTLLAAVARHLYRQRRDTNRALVEAGTLDSAKAETGTRVMRAIAAEWRALAAIEPEPAGLRDGDGQGAWAFERVAALEAASIVARTAADLAPTDPEVTGFADAVDTLLWWETAKPSARFLVDTTIALRAQANARRALISANAGQTSLFGVAA